VNAQSYAALHADSRPATRAPDPHGRRWVVGVVRPVGRDADGFILL
jgi:hypothetical protein